MSRVCCVTKLHSKGGIPTRQEGRSIDGERERATEGSPTTEVEISARELEVVDSW